jgi:hypothetical protein
VVRSAPRAAAELRRSLGLALEARMSHRVAGSSDSMNLLTTGYASAREQASAGISADWRACVGSHGSGADTFRYGRRRTGRGAATIRLQRRCLPATAAAVCNCRVVVAARIAGGVEPYAWASYACRERGRRASGRIAGADDRGRLWASCGSNASTPPMRIITASAPGNEFRDVLPNAGRPTILGHVPDSRHR